MATYPVHDAYYNNQHVYFWDGDTVVAVPRTPGGNVFRKLFIYFALVAITSTVMKYSDTIAAWANTVYTHWFPVQPVSPLARTLLELLAEPDLWRIESGQLRLRDGDIIGLCETSVNGDIYLSIDKNDMSCLLSEHDRKVTILPAYRRTRQAVTDRAARAVADRIALPRYRTSQCAFPSPPVREAIVLPSTAALGVALPPADAKENPCTEQQPSLRQRSLRPDVGPTR